MPIDSNVAVELRTRSSRLSPARLLPDAAASSRNEFLPRVMGQLNVCPTIVICLRVSDIVSQYRRQQTPGGGVSIKRYVANCYLMWPRRGRRRGRRRWSRRGRRRGHRSGRRSGRRRWNRRGRRRGPKCGKRTQKGTQKMEQKRTQKRT